MKRLAIIAPLALLAACEARDDAAAPDATETETMPVDAAATAPAVVATPGSYDVTLPDGTKFVSTLMADGTYVDRDADDKVTEKGTWAMKDGKACFDPEGDAPESCSTSGTPAADGSFTATNEKGETVTVKPRAG
jgi:hypothetical protein